MRIIEGEIKKLKYRVLDMAELVLLQLDNVILAVSNLDYDLAQKVRKKEKKVDKYDLKIDKQCEKIIALHQPVAIDLRFVFSVVKINSYLEQIGDIINGIARKILEIRHHFDNEFLEELQLANLMSQIREIVTCSLNGYFQEDLELSKSVFPKDDIIDQIHRESFEIIVQRIQEKTDKTAEIIQLLLIIKSLEKIADFAVSIAEEAVFHQEGEYYKHKNLTKIN